MLIVDMPMPMNCGECRFRADGWCYGVAEFENQPTALNFDARPSWCPIKGVLPDEHGDLIDRDELRKMKVFSQEFNRYVVPMMYIEEAKPIIAAERQTE